MFQGDKESAGEPREVEVTMLDETKIKGDIIDDGEGGLAIKLPGDRLTHRPEIFETSSDVMQPVTPVAVFVQITDKVRKQLSQEGESLLEEGESLLAWVRVKGGDKKFVTKTTLFSLGAIAAITITRRAIRHYKSR